MAIPDVGSLQKNVTVTGVLFQPPALALGEVEVVMLGGVLSRLTVTDVLAVFPALSVVVPEITWFAPSFVRVCGAGQLATPEVWSLQLNVTVTLLLFQPAALGAGDTV